MNRERFEWVMSGLDRYVLTKAEDQFIKTAWEDFEERHALTEHQEERLENLYKEKSRLIPNKNLSPSKEISTRRAKLRRPSWKSRFDRFDM